jgi:hypothetical protein
MFKLHITFDCHNVRSIAVSFPNPLIFRYYLPLIDYSTDAKICFFTFVGYYLFDGCLGSPCKKGEDGGNQAVSKGKKREGQCKF